MSNCFQATTPPSFYLPNGLTVFGLNEEDTVMVYRNIFEQNCYLRHGITIRNGDCVIDVGANTGLFILFLNHLAVDVQVYAFEPVPAIFRVLQENCKQYNTLAVQLFNVGLAHRSEVANFTFYPRMSNASTLYPDWIMGQSTLCPNVEVSGKMYFPTTIRDQVPTQPKESMVRFYNQQHRFYCGIDLHARTMHICVLDAAGTVVYDRNLPCHFETQTLLGLTGGTTGANQPDLA